ncbi:cytochrome o ubiquinol oxidase subunit IV [Caulobacter vibrioides]|uniref:Cytochrome bo(3) ubiquinol oxidase subunit 4 n=2 Tax=Caulobacter vibrioides TaxID=155892 RepID=Q9A7F3_CAUVC|nr:cytochrome o ubiquinol oxidase subunit IV [Caulobacter vibrioides]YP_002517221.1 quinol cytochrome oxidase polypeptide IV [Caulobacter vibrioides NA1000]AAK23746.1 ubiquinol oxidase subunit IV [Caulobacter vibrioides CB15]ACL95313.1 quinol cytochrome oxidase polypeptide IV [Caulobacter vibrioides NA1000]ATC28649.1 cytochrome o ubiquinol oxidase subunit IV [Caulobacter vibrioides]AZH12905.1 cytochrome o ubiquinol oxidase subunit IV [Caulobacter vibrioides]QXZ53831.1 cytochrome o ubiquinol o
MSAASHDAHPHDEHGDAHEAAHGTLKDYVIGFVLAVILTAIPFWLVMGDVLPSAQMTAVAVMGLAVIQVVVHMIYFLHMNTRSEGGWTMLALIFTLILVVITLAGSLWVMHNLNTHMMPEMMPDMRQAP